MNRITAGLGLCLGTLLGAGSPVLAANNLACATQLIDDRLDQEIFAVYRANANIGEALIARVGDKLKACTAANGWSSQAIESAVRVMFGEILSHGTLRELAEFKISASALEGATDKFIAAMSPEEVKQFVDGGLSDDKAGAFVKHLHEQGVIAQEEMPDRLATLIGEYAASRANSTIFTTEFARQ